MSEYCGKYSTEAMKQMNRKTAAALCLAGVIVFCSCNAGCAEVSPESMSASSSQATEAVIHTTTAEQTTAAETTAEVTSSGTAESSEETTTVPETTGTASAETTTAETTVTDTSSVTEKPPERDINSYRRIGENGILVAGMDNHYRGIMFYGGTYGYCDQYVLDVKEFQAALPQVNVCSMVIPTSLDFYNPPEYSGYTAVQKEKIDYTESGLKAAGITNIRVYDVLEKHKNEEIYARTDHHWMPLGAYYAAEKFCMQLKLPISPLSEYRKETCGGYVGSMYYYSQDPVLESDPEQYDVYYSPNEKKLKTTYYNRYYQNGTESNLFLCNDASYYYLSFLGSDDLIAHVKTDVKNGRKLVVIKESYGNALIPFLTEAFEDIYVLDLRYCEVNAVDFCKKTGATDLLFANCAYTIAGGNCDYFAYIRSI